MEYLIYSDPLWGKRVKLTDEHKSVARWFNDELFDDEILLQVFLNALKHTQGGIVQGKEMRVTFSHGEAVFECHGLFHDDEDLNQYAEDELSLDESELTAVCGVEDLQGLVESWLTFR